jgi:hypothetical protein
MDCHACPPPAETTVMNALKNWGKGEWAYACEHAHTYHLGQAWCIVRYRRKECDKMVYIHNHTHGACSSTEPTENRGGEEGEDETRKSPYCNELGLPLDSAPRL